MDEAAAVVDVGEVGVGVDLADPDRQPFVEQALAIPDRVQRIEGLGVDVGVGLEIAAVEIAVIAVEADIGHAERAAGQPEGGVGVDRDAGFGKIARRGGAWRPAAVQHDRMIAGQIGVERETVVLGRRAQAARIAEQMRARVEIVGDLGLSDTAAQGSEADRGKAGCGGRVQWSSRRHAMSLRCNCRGGPPATAYDTYARAAWKTSRWPVGGPSCSGPAWCGQGRRFNARGRGARPVSIRSRPRSRFRFRRPGSGSSSV